MTGVVECPLRLAELNCEDRKVSEACVDGRWMKKALRPVALCCVLRCFVTAGRTPTCEQRSSLSVPAADGPEGLISGKS